MDFQTFKTDFEWRERRGRWDARIDDRDWDTEAYSWEIVPKRNGKYFAKAHRWNRKVRLPFRDFDTAEGAMEWAMRYEFDKLQDVQESFRNDERIQL